MWIFFNRMFVPVYISLLRVIFEILFTYIVLWKLLELITNINILCDLMFFNMIDATYPVPMSLCPHWYNQELFLCVVQVYTQILRRVQQSKCSQALACQTCVADTCIGNLGQHLLCWTRLRFIEKSPQNNMIPQKNYIWY